ncbi:hypothetical protein [Rhodanobacter aciditrophus]
MGRIASMGSLLVSSPAMDGRFCFSRMEPREVQPKTKKPGTLAGFFVDT